MLANGPAMRGAHSFKIQFGISSGPVDLLTLKLANLRSTSSTDMMNLAGMDSCGFLATACFARRGLCHRFSVIDLCDNIYIYLFV